VVSHQMLYKISIFSMDNVWKVKIESDGPKKSNIFKSYDEMQEFMRTTINDLNPDQKKIEDYSGDSQ
jgi:hypothetical protein